MAENVIESIWLAIIDGEFWPVFVFPDHSVPTDFVKTRPKDNPLALPCLILCRHEFAWCRLEVLAEYDPSNKYTDETDEDSPSGRERIKAFEEAVEFHNIDHYHDLVRKKERATRKRASAVDDESDDDDGNCAVLLPSPASLAKRSSSKSHLGLVTPRKTPTFRKLSVENLAGIDNGDDDGLVDPSTFTPSKPARKRPRPDSAKVRAFKLDDVAQEQLRLLNMKKGNGKGPVEKKKEPEATRDPSKVNVYVGVDDKLFIINKGSIERYSAFAKHIVGNGEVGYRNRWNRLDNINTDVFASVAEFFNTSDYTPVLIEGRTPHLKNVKSVNQMEAAAEKACLMWDFAAEFEMENLQLFVRRKIDAQSPLASNSLLILTRIVYSRPSNGTKVDMDMRVYLRDEISERFYDVMVKDAFLLKRVLQGNEELRLYVHDRLAKEKELGSSEAVGEDDDDVDDDDE